MRRRSSLLDIRFAQRVSGRSLALDRRAFTLIEIMIVMVLMTIVGAVVLPAMFRSVAVDPMQQATQPIMSLLRFGQKSAAQIGSPVRVALDPATGRYLVTAMSVDTPLAAGVLELPLAARVTTDSLRAIFTFKPVGGADADSLLVTSNAGLALIRVDRWTGEIRVVRR